MVQIIETGPCTTKLDINGEVYRISHHRPHVSRFGVTQWPYEMDTEDAAQLMADIQAEDAALYDELTGHDMALSWEDVMVDAR